MMAINPKTEGCVATHVEDCLKIFRTKWGLEKYLQSLFLERKEQRKLLQKRHTTRTNRYKKDIHLRTSPDLTYIWSTIDQRATHLGGYSTEL